MKVNDVGLDNGYAIGRGWVGPTAAAGTGIINLGDLTTGTNVAPVNSLTLVGQLINDAGDGSAVVDIQAILTEYTNNSAIALVPGNVVVIDTTADLAVTTTTTAQDTRPIGIVLGNIGAGSTGPVQTGGIVQSINVSSAVTRGYFAETAAVVTEATQNATRRAGSFGMYLEAGTTPAVLLFGITDTAGVGGTYETTTKGGGSVEQAHGNMGSTETFDPATANVHTGTLNAACTFTLTAPADSTHACLIEIRTTQDGTGGWTITWPGSVTWAGGTPSIITTAGALTVYVLETLDGGTTWIGAVAGGLGASLFATPTITYGTSSAGVSGKVIASDSIIAKPTEADLSLSDNTTNNASITKHGFVPKGDGVTTHFLNGNLAWATPAGTGSTGEILISDTPSTPLIFADLIQNEAQNDLVYADP